LVTNLSNQVRPRKALAQYFLADASVLDDIVGSAQLSPDDIVLEIGPGLGALTRRLVSQVARVVTVEMDPILAANLSRRLGQPSNLTSLAADARTVDIASLIGGNVPYKIVANLPYYAAKPIVRRFLETDTKPSLMIVMVQQEVAKSMVAQSGEMTLLSVATQFHAFSSLVCTVPPSAFHPRPKVMSAVVKLEPWPIPPVEVSDSIAFLALVKAGFTSPRKQLRNSLSHGLATPSDQVTQLLTIAKLDGRRRAESLSLKEWAKIFETWERWNSCENSSVR
jgi:16S rRNA (adenine1518-N6/adenine1519-N6)-dimethyltransferase